VNPDELAHLRRARDLMDREYARPLDVPAMAKAALMSPSQFARRFRDAYGETPYAYLMCRRIERAMALLRRGELSVTEVCLAVGATSLGSFSSRFSELVGKAPAPTGRATTARRRRCPPASPGRGRVPSAIRQERRSRASPYGPSVDGMTLKLSHTFMIVDDQDKALAFYRDVLGLELKNDVPLGDERWLTVASPEQPDVEIVLVTASMGHSPQDAEALSALLAKGVLGSAIFATDDLAATFERLRTAGAEVLQEPIDQPYGVRDCAFRDPAGNHLRFSQAL